MNLGEEIVFELPAIANGVYCDFGTSYFRFKIEITYTGVLDNFNYIRWERGPESMFRRVRIDDATGNNLEHLEHYNELYALQELTTSSKHQIRNQQFHREGLKLPMDFDAKDNLLGIKSADYDQTHVLQEHPDLGAIISAGSVVVNETLTNIDTYLGQIRY